MYERCTRWRLVGKYLEETRHSHWNSQACLLYYNIKYELVNDLVTGDHILIFSELKSFCCNKKKSMISSFFYFSKYSFSSIKPKNTPDRDSVTIRYATGTRFRQRCRTCRTILDESSFNTVNKTLPTLPYSPSSSQVRRCITIFRDQNNCRAAVPLNTWNTSK